MDKETYKALRATMIYLNTQGIPMKNKGIINASQKVWDWIEEVAKEYENVLDKHN